VGPHAVAPTAVKLGVLIVKFKFCVWQPFTEVYVPLVVYVVPFTGQVYELQAVSADVLVELVLMVKTNVFVAQPDTEVYVPLVVYDCPFTDHV
jgi:hypothetical protein